MTTDIERRILLLERDNRRLRAGLLAAAAIAVALPLLALGGAGRTTAAVTADEVKATKFVLVDEHGIERGIWATAQRSGNPELAMIGATGQAQVQLSVDGVTAMLRFRDDAKKLRLGMAVDRFPHLMLHDDDERPRIHLTVGSTGAPSLIFAHQDGTMPAAFGLKGDGSPWLKPDAWLERLAPKPDAGGK